MASSLLLFAAAAALTASAAASCGRSDDVPCLRIPPCGGVAPAAAAAPFYVSDAATRVLASPQTKVAICHTASGLRVVYEGDDAHVVTPWTRCNDPVFERSSTFEFFASPVERPTDDPIWYHEIDGGPANVLWAGVSNNSKGNATTCDAAAGDACVAGNLNCSGAQTFPSAPGLRAVIANTSTGWRETLDVPFAAFPASFVGRGRWPLWRVNFYRYAYPHGPDATFSNYQLSAWSPTHDPSFHTPSRFGVALLVDASDTPLPFPDGRKVAAARRNLDEARRRTAVGAVGELTPASDPAWDRTGDPRAVPPPQDFGQWPLGVF